MDIDEKDDAQTVDTTESTSTYDVVAKAMDDAGMKFSNDKLGSRLAEGAEPNGNDQQSAEAAAQEARDARGRFAKKEPAAPVDPAAVVDTTSKDNAESNISTAPKPAEAPAGWTTEAKAEWLKLTPAVQQAVIKRENEISEGGRRWSEEKRTYEETLAPLRQAAQKYGLQDKEGLQRLLVANDFLERDPEAAIDWFAKNYGVEIQIIGRKQQPQAQPQPQPFVDPSLAVVTRELETIKQTLAERETAEIEQTINSFRNDQHPHFDKVRATMGQLITAGKAANMEEAYEQAIWLDPEIRAGLITAQAARTAEEAKTKAREQAEKARKAGVSVPGGSPVNGNVAATPQKFSDGRDAARAAMDQLGY